MATDVIYGMHNGQEYPTTHHVDGEPQETKIVTHHDPMLQVTGGEAYQGVQIGVVPHTEMTDEVPAGWYNENGQYLTLDWDGCNRLIRAVRKYRDKAWGKPE